MSGPQADAAAAARADAWVAVMPAVFVLIWSNRRRRRQQLRVAAR